MTRTPSAIGPRSCEPRTVAEAVAWCDQILVDGRRVLQTNWLEAIRAGDVNTDALDAALIEYDAQAATTRAEFRRCLQQVCATVHAQMQEPPR